MIRSRSRILDTSGSTIEECTLRMSEIIEKVRKETIQEEESPAPVKETPEPHGSRMPSPQGRIPFGFQQNPYGRAIFEPELKWIERTHELALQKLSTEKIAGILNREDTTSKRAGKWSRPAVWRILKRLDIKTVTKSFCNDPAETPHSVMPLTVWTRESL